MIPINFNCYIYRFLYSEIRKYSDEECHNHYILYGKTEGRICTISELIRERNLYNKIYEYANNIDTIFSNDKEHFRYICYSKINELELKYNNININYNKLSHNETVFIEFRALKHIKFNILNMCGKLPNWKHTVVCGNDNYDYIKKICLEISDKINIIKLEKNNINLDEYSLLLASTSFWKQFTGEHILIHQEDSLIFHTDNIDFFLKYDYVGAPWNSNYHYDEYLVGNGGFSLRKRDIMIYITENYNIINYSIKGITKNDEYYIKNTLNNKIIPEDFFFVKCMIDNNIGVIPSHYEAINFSSENIKSHRSIGGHAFWIADENWIERIEKLV
jgi:hypothetical protein